MERSRVRLPAGALSDNNSGQVANTHVPVTGQRAVMLCDREGNHTSGFGLAVHHRLQWFIHIQAQWPWKGRWATYAPYWGMVHFTFYLYSLITRHWKGSKYLVLCSCCGSRAWFAVSLLLDKTSDRRFDDIRHILSTVCLTAGIIRLDCSQTTHTQQQQLHQSCTCA